MRPDKNEVLLDQPVLCKDGKLGLIIRDEFDVTEIGVQVPDEEDIRWIKRDDLEREWKEPPQKGRLYQVISRFTIHLPYLCGLDDEEWKEE